MLSPLLAVLAVIGISRAQTRTSAIVGAVRDASGAVVEGALVSVRQLTTGVARSAQTGPEGNYRIPSLEVGEYEVTAAKEGFKTSEHRQVLLQLQSDTVVDHHLALGAASESIVVTERARTVEADVSTVSDLVDTAAIQRLPLNGRDYIQLATLLASASPASAQSRTANTGYGLQLSIAGSRPFQNSFSLDGVVLSSYHGSTPGSINGLNLGVEAIQEFSVLSSTYSAEYGRAAGGIVNAVTRSGGNDLHGSLFYFHRNDNLDARNFFDADQVPEFRRHQFGAAIGGPVSHDRSFYFVNYEGLREARGNTAIDTTISDDARQGILTAGRLQVDPLVMPVLALYPRPNGVVFGDTGLFTYDNAARADENFVTGRFDHYINEYDRLFTRYSFNAGEQSDQTTFAAGDRSNATRNQSAAFEEIHIFSPDLLNTFRLGFQRTYTVAGETETRIPGTDGPELAFTPAAQAIGVMEISGLSVFPGGTGALDFDRHAFNSYQAADNLQWLTRRHSLRVGARLERTQFNTDSRGTNFGEYQFSSIARFLTNQPDQFAALLPGADTVRGHRQWIAAWYVQDSWRISSHLTLDLGLRHEWATVPSEVNGKVANLDELTSAELRVGGPLFDNPSFTNFAPRVGLAWRPWGHDRTVIRGGYGIFPDLLLSQFILQSGVRNPPFFSRGSIRQLSQGDFPKGGYGVLVEDGQSDLRADRIPRDLSQPYVQQWNLTVQQGLGFDTDLRLAYAGSHGLYLSSVTGDANLAPSVILSDGRRFFPEGGDKLNPNFSWIRNRTFDAQSFYHGLQAQLSRRFHNGFQARVGYTFSKSIDDSSWFFEANESGNASTLPVNEDLRYNRGPSSHDQRHYFAASGVWELPSPAAGLRGAILGGWQLATIVSYGSGPPFSASISYDAARTMASRPGIYLGQRPDLAAGADHNPVTRDPNRWFDPSVFRRPTPGFLGNLGRNTMAGPSLTNFDLSVSKRKKVESLGESGYLEIRAEFFNAFNHTNFNLPEQRRMVAFSAASTPEDVGRITSARESREIQFGVKLGF